MCHLLIIYFLIFFITALLIGVRFESQHTLHFLIYLYLVCTPFAKHAFKSPISDADLAVLSSLMPHGMNDGQTSPPILWVGSPRATDWFLSCAEAVEPECILSANSRSVT